MLAAGSFIFRHWKKIIAVIIVLTLIVIIWLDDTKDICAPGGGGGGSSPVSSEGLAYPVDPDTPISSGFGMRWGSPHNGMDFAGAQGAPIYAFADGNVIASQDQGVSGFGGWVVLLHNIDGKEYSTVYGHQDPGGNMVSEGETVTAGQQIARIGNSGQSTGAHLHFEIHEGNRLTASAPFDPAPWVERAKTGGTADSDNKDSSEASDNSDDKDAASPVDPETIPDDAQSIRELRASQIIDGGKQRGADEKVIIAAIAAGMVESDLHNLASDAVPESKNYPNDGVAPGDYDSVGLFQQRASIWADGAGGMKGLMDPAQQIGWFYDTAEGVPHDSPGQIAADVERPAAEYRGRYAEREAEARKYYSVLEEGASGTLGDIGGGNCVNDASGGGGAGAPNEQLGRLILAAAKEQFGLPYVWGGGDHHGATGGGFDCSGLTMYAVYQATNGEVALAHQTNSQIADPNVEKVAWEDRQPGDLLFFGSPANYHHVSIYSGTKDGVDMQYEAQTFGVPSGEYPVRMDEGIEVRRVVVDNAVDADEKDEAGDSDEK